MKFIKIFKWVLAILFFVCLGIFLMLVLPDKLACSGLNYDGAKAINIFGSEVFCSGENIDVLNSFFHLNLGILLVVLIIWLTVKILIYRKFKN